MNASLDFKALEQYLSDEYSLLTRIEHSRHVSLSPMYIGRWRSGIQALLDKELNVFSEQLQGVMVAYRKLRIQQRMGSLQDCQTHVRFTVLYDAIVFRPHIGRFLKGTVNKISLSFIGCVVHGWFNVSIHKPKSGAPAWSQLQLNFGDEIIFLIENIKTQHNFIHINGKLTEDCVERTRELSRENKNSVIKEPVKFSSTVSQNSTDLVDGEGVKKEEEEEKRSSEKHKRTEEMDSPKKHKHKKSKKSL